MHEFDAFEKVMKSKYFFLSFWKLIGEGELLEK